MNLAVRDYTLFLTPNKLISTFHESVCGRPQSGRFGLDLDGIKSFPCETCSSIETPTFIFED